MEVSARVEGVRPFTIHGQPWRVVYFAHEDDPDTIRQAQFSDDQLPTGLRAGERVLVLYLLDVVAGIRRAEPAATAPSG